MLEYLPGPSGQEVIHCMAFIRDVWTKRLGFPKQFHCHDYRQPFMTISDNLLWKIAWLGLVGLGVFFGVFRTVAISSLSSEYKLAWNAGFFKKSFFGLQLSSPVSKIVYVSFFSAACTEDFFGELSVHEILPSYCVGQILQQFFEKLTNLASMTNSENALQL